MSTASKYQRIYTVVNQIPAGYVTTYGDVAVMSGLPGHARLVGYALHALPFYTEIPWHRVINAKGMISLGRAYPGGELQQRHLLENEGIPFDENGRVNLKQFRYRTES